MSVKSYFDSHSHRHNYHKDPNFYNKIIQFFKKFDDKKNIRRLDVGCGDGIFIKSLIDGGIKGNIIGSDVSHSMINYAKENLSGKQIELILADGFHLPIREKEKFDFIHLDMVLHHLIGKSRSESIQLAQSLLNNLSKLIQKNGFIII